MTYPDYTDIKRNPPLSPEKQKAIIDALVRLHPTGNEMGLEEVRKR